MLLPPLKRDQERSHLHQVVDIDFAGRSAERRNIRSQRFDYHHESVPRCGWRPGCAPTTIPSLNGVKGGAEELPQVLDHTLQELRSAFRWRWLIRHIAKRRSLHSSHSPPPIHGGLSGEDD